MEQELIFSVEVQSSASQGAKEKERKTAWTKKLDGGIKSVGRSQQSDKLIIVCQFQLRLVAYLYFEREKLLQSH